MKNELDKRKTNTRFLTKNYTDFLNRHPTKDRFMKLILLYRRLLEAAWITTNYGNICCISDEHFPARIVRHAFWKTVNLVILAAEGR